MDPNEALRVMRMFTRQILDRADSLETANDYERQALDGESLAEHVQALDEWLSNGGFLPTDWQH